MGILSKLFGYEGTIRFEGITIDGRRFTGKTQIETFNVDNKEVEEKLKNWMLVEYGYKIKEIKIIAMT